MKQFICLSSRRLQFAMVVCGLSFTLLSCGDKVDKTQDKMEDLIKKYEKKVEDKDFAPADASVMYKELREIEADFKLNVGTPIERWTDKQRARAVRLGTRMEKVEDMLR